MGGYPQADYSRQMAELSDLTSLVAQVNGGEITRKQALVAIGCRDVEAMLHASVEASETPVTSGVGCSPGAAVGQVYFTSDDVLDAADRGELVILAAAETTPADEVAMRVIEGVLTAKGGMASHAAVVARGWGLPAVCGAEAVQFVDDMMVVGATEVPAGATITLDGTSGEIFLGDLGIESSATPPELETLLSWADEVRGDRLFIRANADAADDATIARQLGAQGIGLCRTEHMFMGERLPVVQAVLEARDEASSDAALAELVAVQRSDFAQLFEAMDTLPVTVRLLDAPLHEFSPEQHEHNPMLGLRGVRLALVRGGIFEAQVRAICGAIEDRLAAGGSPLVDIMVPLVSTASEMVAAARLVRSELDAHLPAGASVKVGTMIETPRAALVAGAIAASVDFFSFGTNDLTQLTFGFSRDDVEGPIITPYIADGILEVSPFERLDADGVGRLVELAVDAGRTTRSDLECGICGEHGGDPESIAFFVAAGLNYVSCSPYRVPVARLAAAQALLSLEA